MTTKEILIKYQDYLKKDDFQGFYKALWHNVDVSPSDLGKVTEFILNAGIDPLIYMDDVPALYLYESTISDMRIPDHIKSIGEFAFRHCSSLTSVTIPNSVTRIGNYAFYYCTSLTRIEIPSRVTGIGMKAFAGCSSLININYGGTKRQWRSIHQENDVFFKTAVTEIKCIDGTIKL